MKSELTFGDLLDLPSQIPTSMDLSNGRWTRYGSTIGTLELRATICRYEQDRQTVTGITPESVLITHGATQALSVLFEWHRRYSVGKLHLPTPSYPSYWDQASEHGARVRAYEIERLDTPKDMLLLSTINPGDLLVINSPHNPTGHVLSSAALDHILQDSRARGWFVVLDAVYDELYDSPPYAIDLDSEQSFFYVNSVSKTFGAPDLRVGWLCAPQDLRRVCHNILENQSIAVSTESQRHAQDILTNSTWQQRRELRLTLEHRGKQTQKLLRQVAGLEVSATGGPYGLVKLPSDIDVEVFCARLRESYDAAVLPGSYFRAPRDTFRIPLGMAPHAARRTVRVLKQALESIRIEDIRSAISNLCESYSAEFLRLARSGILQILEQHSGAINRAQIEEILGRDGKRSLTNEDFNILYRLRWLELRRQDAAIRLTSLGRVAVPYLYYYWLVRGAYGEILDHKEDGVRDLAEVGQASCQMSRFGAFPLLRDFLKEFGSADSIVLDVGCGTGEGTVQFVREAPGLRALGFDVCSESIQRAQEYAHSLGLTSVVSFQVADALDSLPREESPGTMVPTFSFVLHELVGQRGIAEVIRYLGQVRAEYPQSHVFVIEPDVRSRAEISRAGPDAAAFYDFYWEKYYLIHSLTKQQLLPRAQWHEVFTAAGYKVVKERAIPTMVDPCELEIGYVLYPLRSHS